MLYLYNCNVKSCVGQVNKTLFVYQLTILNNVQQLEKKHYCKCSQECY